MGRPVAACLAAVGKAAVLALALTVAGCASDQESREQAYADAHRAYQMRGPVPPQRAQAQELEDDGLPPQAPPPIRRQREPDDPSEPFSPNYGSSARRADAMPATSTTAGMQRVAAF